MLLVGRIGVWEEAMPKPYSADLRERVLRADAAGLAPAGGAERFGVGLSAGCLWGARDGGGGSRAGGGRGARWCRALDGPSVAPGGARGRAALCQAAGRRAGTG